MLRKVSHKHPFHATRIKRTMALNRAARAGRKKPHTRHPTRRAPRQDPLLFRRLPVGPPQPLATNISAPLPTVAENSNENLPENINIQRANLPEYVRNAIDRNNNPVDIVDKILSRQGVDMLRKEKLVRYVLAKYTPAKLERHATRSRSRSRSRSA